MVVRCHWFGYLKWRMNCINLDISNRPLHLNISNDGQDARTFAQGSVPSSLCMTDLYSLACELDLGVVDLRFFEGFVYSISSSESGFERRYRFFDGLWIAERV